MAKDSSLGVHMYFELKINKIYIYISISNICNVCEQVNKKNNRWTGLYNEPVVETFTCF